MSPQPRLALTTGIQDKKAWPDNDMRAFPFDIASKRAQDLLNYSLRRERSFSGHASALPDLSPACPR